MDDVEYELPLALVEKSPHIGSREADPEPFCLSPETAA
jgi:hypothetical protein